MYLPYPLEITQREQAPAAHAFANAGRTIHRDKVDGPLDDA
jgi:hypothetical protein